MSAERVMISGHRKLFHDQMKARMTLVAIADFDNGIMMCQMMRHSDRPSMRAASIKERGTASKLALKTKMQTMVEHCGRASPSQESSSPSWPVMRYAGMIVAWNGTIMHDKNNSSTALRPRKPWLSA